MIILSRCDKCPHRAVIFQRYSGMRLCREHLQQDVLRKAREAIRRTGLFSQSARIIIELDGGKNCAANAHILVNTFQRRRDIDLLGLVIDDWQGESRAAAKALRLADQLKIPLLRKSPQDLDSHEPKAALSIEERRRLLLQSAIESQAGIIATSEDLDDLALEIFLKYLRGDIGTHEEESAEVHWIRPLERIPKREARLYSLMEDLRGLDDQKSCQEELYEQAKKLLSKFDSKHPGTNYSLLRGWERRLKSRLEASGPKRGQSL